MRAKNKSRTAEGIPYGKRKVMFPVKKPHEVNYNTPHTENQVEKCDITHGNGGEA